MAPPAELPDIDLTELLDSMIRLARAGVHVGIPARVESYDPDTGRVRAQPLIRIASYDEGGNRRVERAPVVPAARVRWPAGGGASLTFDLKEGDVVVLHFLDRSIGAWAQGGAESDPEHGEHHDMADAVADACTRPESQPWPRAPGGGLTLGVDNGVRIRVSPTGIEIGHDGANPMQAVALGGAVASRLAALESFAATHTHAVSAGVAGATGISLAQPSVQSSLVTVRE